MMDDISYPNPSNKPKRDGQDPREAACVICGGDQYTWGKLGSQGGVVYLEQGMIFGIGMGQPLEARRCDICSNVQIFLK